MHSIEVEEYLYTRDGNGFTCCCNGLSQ